MQIQLQNISKSYQLSEDHLKQDVLKDVNLEINKGERVAITGPSGSGKTTLLNIIGTLDGFDSGDFLFENKNISDLSPSQLNAFRNKNIGFVFQSHHLLPQLNALDNVLLPTLVNSNRADHSKAYKRALEWLNKFGLKDDIHKFPAQLSGGESQRVAVIRALINQPEIILADEPTGSLDNTNSENLSSLLIEISKQENISLLIVTHSQKLAEKMEVIKELSNGVLA